MSDSLQLHAVCQELQLAADNVRERLGPTADCTRLDLAVVAVCDAIDSLEREAMDTRSESTYYQDQLNRCNEEVEQLRAENQRLLNAIYAFGEPPPEQRRQIDPVDYLRTRYVPAHYYRDCLDQNERLRTQNNSQSS